MDFSTLKYNISQLKPNEKVITKWPELAEIKEFSDPDDDYFVRAVILMVSEGSPFVKERDFQKIVRGVFAYLNPKDKNLPELLLANEYSEDVRKIKEMIFAFFIFSDNHAFAVWYSKMMDFYYTLAFLQSPPDMDKPDHFKKRSDVNSKLPELHKSLAEYERLIFPNDFVKKVIKEQTTKTITFAERHAQPYGTT